MGTYLLFSPEMFSQEKVIGEKSDIWALGMTFYYLMTGSYPWKDAKDPLQLRDMIQN
jgi:serine/threonine protein kinase